MIQANGNRLNKPASAPKEQYWPSREYNADYDNTQNEKPKPEFFPYVASNQLPYLNEEYPVKVDY